VDALNGRLSRPAPRYLLKNDATWSERSAPDPYFDATGMMALGKHRLATGRDAVGGT